jgi:hypothetical protein
MAESFSKGAAGAQERRETTNRSPQPEGIFSTVNVGFSAPVGA